MGDARNHCWVYQRRKSFVVKKTKFFFLLFCARGSWLYDQNYLGSKVLHQGTRFIPAREADCRTCCEPATANIWGWRGPHRWYLVTLKGWKLDNLIMANDSCGRSDTVDPQIDQNVSTVSEASPMIPDGRQARQRPLSLFTSKYLPPRQGCRH